MKKKSIDPYVDGLMGKLLERLTGIEKKLDIIMSRVSQTSGKPAEKPPVAEQPRRDRVLYEAICADCHKVCEVPFKPSEDRAVYCKSCFAARKSGGKPKPFPSLTPVALPPRPVSKLGMPQAPPPAPAPQAKKAKTTKKSKTKKKR